MGKYRCKTAYGTGENAHAVGELISGSDFSGLSDEVAANWEAYGPKIYGSVYGGAQDGRTRRDAHVTVNNGEIGLPFTDENRAVFKGAGTPTLQEELDNPQWLHRGNVYGAGSGISLYKFDADDDGKTDKKGETGVTYYETKLDEEGYSQYAGCVIRFTEVNINGGTIHRNVYGGGSLGSVGPPAIPPTRTDVAYKKDDTVHGVGWQSQCTVNIAGTIGTPTNFNEVYGGEVYGASRGDTRLDSNLYGSVIWTLVNLLNGADVKNNVFGGGDAGIVKKNTEVNVGQPATPTP